MVIILLLIVVLINGGFPESDKVQDNLSKCICCVCKLKLVGGYLVIPKNIEKVRIEKEENIQKFFGIPKKKKKKGTNILPGFKLTISFLGKQFYVNVLIDKKKKVTRKGIMY